MVDKPVVCSACFEGLEHFSRDLLIEEEVERFTFERGRKVSSGRGQTRLV